MTFALAKNLFPLDRMAHSGRWRQDIQALAIDITGSVLHSVGCGNIAREALRRAVAATDAAGKAAGINPGTTDQARAWLRLGLQAISWSNDIAVYRTAWLRQSPAFAN